MHIEVFKVILAIVTPNREAVKGGGVPIIYTATRAAAEEKAQLLARVLDAMVHDVGDDIFLLIRH